MVVQMLKPSLYSLQLADDNQNSFFQTLEYTNQLCPEMSRQRIGSSTGHQVKTIPTLAIFRRFALFLITFQSD